MSYKDYLTPQNVVCRFELMRNGRTSKDHPLPLSLIIRHAGGKGFVFNQYKFKSLVIALRAAPGVKGTLLVYKTGKIVVAGSNSMKGACRLVEMFIREYLEDSCKLYGYTFDTPKIENVVCSFDLRGPLDLNALNNSNVYNVHYNAATFSGLIMTLKTGDRYVKAIVYSSGKGIMVGETSIEDALMTWEPLYHHLLAFVGSQSAQGHKPGARSRNKGIPLNTKGKISIKKTRRKKVLIMGRRHLDITL